MNQPLTILAPIKLAAEKTEADLLAASEHFQNEFVSQQPGVLRRELIRTGEGQYMDIIQFRSKEDLQKVMEEEAKSPVCREFFSVMDLSGADEDIESYPSLATYS
jgi:hypothetical protein